MRADARPDAPLRVDAGGRLPLEDRSLETVVSGGFLEALDHAEGLWVLRECRRALRPGGLARVRAGGPGAPEWMRDRAALERAALRVGLAPAADAGVAQEALARLPTAATEGGAVLVDLVKPSRTVEGEPLVSVLIAAYSPTFLEEALASALAQTYRNIEIVVCDDSPGPEVEAMVRRVGGGRVRYERNTPALGTRMNYCRCLDLSGGEFAKFLNDDDVLDPACVERLLEAFRLAPDVTLATSHRQRIDSEGRALEDEPATMPIVAHDALVDGASLANAMIMSGINFIGEPTTVMFRRRDLLGETPDYLCFGGVRTLGVVDMPAWATLLLKGDAVVLRQSLSRFRIHGGQQQRASGYPEKGVHGIRSLQREWMTLNLFRRFAADELLLEAFPPGPRATRAARRVLSLQARGPAPADFSSYLAGAPSRRWF